MNPVLTAGHPPSPAFEVTRAGGQEHIVGVPVQAEDGGADGLLDVLAHPPGHGGGHTGVRGERDRQVSALGPQRLGLQALTGPRRPQRSPEGRAQASWVPPWMGAPPLVSFQPHNYPGLPGKEKARGCSLVRVGPELEFLGLQSALPPGLCPQQPRGEGRDVGGACEWALECDGCCCGQVICLRAFVVRWGWQQGFPYSSVGKESACSAGDLSSIPGSGRNPGEGNGNPLQCSCLENPMDRGAQQVTVHGVARVRHDLATKPLITSRDGSRRPVQGAAGGGVWGGHCVRGQGLV